MTGLTDYAAKKILEHLVGKTSWTMPTTYLALFTVAGTDAGTGFTEVSGTGYTRIPTAGAWGSAGGSDPSSISNSGAILSFPTAGGVWGTVVAWGIYDNSSGGNLLAWDYLGNDTWEPCTVSLASPAVITAPAHGLSASDTFVFTTEYGGAQPTFSQSNLSGLLTVVSPTTDTFTVDNGATAVNTSSSGEGQIRKVEAQTISTGAVPTFLSGALVITGT